MIDIELTVRNARAACALLGMTLLLGCGPALSDLEQGDVNDLIIEPGSGDDGAAVPLKRRASMVETIATELPEQLDEYRIGPNDVLNIIVLEHEEVSSARDFNRGIVGTIVKKDGKIYLPIVGPVQAAGYTIEEFHSVLRDHLKGYILSPQFTVDMLKYESQKYYVLGEVAKPGAFPVDGDTTLLEAVGNAGGVRPEGSLEGAYVIRDSALLPINLANVLLRGDTSRNIYMKNRDLIYVPSTADQKVYVLGEVHRPGAIRIPQTSLSLAQALAEAGGLLHVDAKKGTVKLVRGNWQEPTVYTLSYETVIANGDRIRLAPGDRIVVQPTALTTASRYMEQILPFLVGADRATAVYQRVAP